MRAFTSPQVLAIDVSPSLVRRIREHSDAARTMGDSGDTRGTPLVVVNTVAVNFKSYSSCHATNSRSVAYGVLRSDRKAL